MSNEIFSKDSNEGLNLKTSASKVDNGLLGEDGTPPQGYITLEDAIGRINKKLGDRTNKENQPISGFTELFLKGVAAQVEKNPGKNFIFSGTDFAKDIIIQDGQVYFKKKSVESPAKYKRAVSELAKNSTRQNIFKGYKQHSIFDKSEKSTWFCNEEEALKLIEKNKSYLDPNEFDHNATSTKARLKIMAEVISYNKDANKVEYAGITLLKDEDYVIKDGKVLFSHEKLSDNGSYLLKAITSDNGFLNFEKGLSKANSRDTRTDFRGLHKAIKDAKDKTSVEYLGKTFREGTDYLVVGRNIFYNGSNFERGGSFTFPSAFLDYESAKKELKDNCKRNLTFADIATANKVVYELELLKVSIVNAKYSDRNVTSYAYNGITLKEGEDYNFNLRGKVTFHGGMLEVGSDFYNAAKTSKFENYHVIAREWKSDKNKLKADLGASELSDIELKEVVRKLELLSDAFREKKMALQYLNYGDYKFPKEYKVNDIIFREGVHYRVDNTGGFSFNLEYFKKGEAFHQMVTDSRFVTPEYLIDLSDKNGVSDARELAAYTLDNINLFKNNGTAEKAATVYTSPDGTTFKVGEDVLIIDGKVALVNKKEMLRADGKLDLMEKYNDYRTIAVAKEKRQRIFPSSEDQKYYNELLDGLKKATPNESGIITIEGQEFKQGVHFDIRSDNGEFIVYSGGNKAINLTFEVAVANKKVADKQKALTEKSGEEAKKELEEAKEEAEKAKKELEEAKKEAEKVKEKEGRKGRNRKAKAAKPQAAPANDKPTFISIDEAKKRIKLNYPGEEIKASEEIKALEEIYNKIKKFPEFNTITVENVELQKGVDYTVKKGKGKSEYLIKFNEGAFTDTNSNVKKAIDVAAKEVAAKKALETLPEEKFYTIEEVKDKYKAMGRSENWLSTFDEVANAMKQKADNPITSGNNTSKKYIEFYDRYKFVLGEDYKINDKGELLINTKFVDEESSPLSNTLREVINKTIKRKLVARITPNKNTLGFLGKEQMQDYSPNWGSERKEAIGRVYDKLQEAYLEEPWKKSHKINGVRINLGKDFIVTEFDQVLLNKKSVQKTTGNLNLAVKDEITTNKEKAAGAGKDSELKVKNLPADNQRVTTTISVADADIRPTGEAHTAEEPKATAEEPKATAEAAKPRVEVDFSKPYIDVRNLNDAIYQQVKADELKTNTEKLKAEQSTLKHFENIEQRHKTNSYVDDTRLDELKKTIAEVKQEIEKIEDNTSKNVDKKTQQINNFLEKAIQAFNEDGKLREFKYEDFSIPREAFRFDENGKVTEVSTTLFKNYNARNAPTNTWEKIKVLATTDANPRRGGRSGKLSFFGLGSLLPESEGDGLLNRVYKGAKNLFSNPVEAPALTGAGIGVVMSGMRLQAKLSGSDPMYKIAHENGNEAAKNAAENALNADKVMFAFDAAVISSHAVATLGKTNKVTQLLTKTPGLQYPIYGLLLYTAWQESLSATELGNPLAADPLGGVAANISGGIAGGVVGGSIAGPWGAFLVGLTTALASAPVGIEVARMTQTKNKIVEVLDNIEKEQPVFYDYLLQELTKNANGQYNEIIDIIKDTKHKRNLTKKSKGNFVDNSEEMAVLSRINEVTDEGLSVYEVINDLEKKIEEAIEKKDEQEVSKLMKDYHEMLESLVEKQDNAFFMNPYAIDANSDARKNAEALYSQAKFATQNDAVCSYLEEEVKKLYKRNNVDNGGFGDLAQDNNLLDILPEYGYQIEEWIHLVRVANGKFSNQVLDAIKVNEEVIGFNDEVMHFMQVRYGKLLAAAKDNNIKLEETLLDIPKFKALDISKAPEAKYRISTYDVEDNCIEQRDISGPDMSSDDLIMFLNASTKQSGSEINAKKFSALLNSGVLGFNQENVVSIDIRDIEEVSDKQKTLLIVKYKDATGEEKETNVTIPYIDPRVASATLAAKYGYDLDGAERKYLNGAEIAIINTDQKPILLFSNNPYRHYDSEKVDKDFGRKAPYLYMNEQLQKSSGKMNTGATELSPATGTIYEFKKDNDYYPLLSMVKGLNPVDTLPSDVEVFADVSATFSAQVTVGVPSGATGTGGAGDSDLAVIGSFSHVQAAQTSAVDIFDKSLEYKLTDAELKKYGGRYQDYELNREYNISKKDSTAQAIAELIEKVSQPNYTENNKDFDDIKTLTLIYLHQAGEATTASQSSKYGDIDSKYAPPARPKSESKEGEAANPYKTFLEDILSEDEGTRKVFNYMAIAKDIKEGKTFKIGNYFEGVIEVGTDINTGKSGAVRG